MRLQAFGFLNFFSQFLVFSFHTYFFGCWLAFQFWFQGHNSLIPVSDFLFPFLPGPTHPSRIFTFNWISLQMNNARWGGKFVRLFTLYQGDQMRNCHRRNICLWKFRAMKFVLRCTKVCLESVRRIYCLLENVARKISYITLCWARTIPTLIRSMQLYVHTLGYQTADSRLPLHTVCTDQL